MEDSEKQNCQIIEASRIAFSKQEEERASALKTQSALEEKLSEAQRNIQTSEEELVTLRALLADQQTNMDGRGDFKSNSVHVLTEHIENIEDSKKLLQQ